MRINVGTKNPTKISAVEEIIKDYHMFAGAEVYGLKVSSGVSKQPISLEETAKGAVNRAINSFKNCNYSFGIESGLTPLSYALTGYVNISVCAIYDGKNKPFIGASSGYEYPPKVIREIIENNLEVDEAMFKCGFTENKDIGQSEGAISILTNGRIDRKNYMQGAIRNALIKLENPRFI